MTISKPTCEIDLIIFDLDGTLIDSAKDITSCVNLTLERCGKNPLPVEVILPHVGKGIQPLLREIFEVEAKGAVEEAFSIFREYYSSHLTDTTNLYPGMAAVLEYYREKKKVVLTNKAQSFADSIMLRLGLESHFMGVYGREAFAKQKPDPTPVIEICKKFSLPTHRAVMVGDTDVDILAGKGAGAVAVAALYGYGDHADIATLNPEYSVTKPEELVGLFA